ncbi:hypothetical protein DFH09DRAFT_1442563 [Mycena vulgaris]|nr:hypothetical protein DFH09DRAFT_1442563 [Mycena vulgaris]
MPSFLCLLLEGKFEAVPPVITPTTPRFDIPAAPPANDKDGFTLFKSIRTPPGGTPDQSVAQSKVLDYHLSLNLPGPKEESTRALGVVFEADPDAQILLSESVIAERRLSPLEAFLLVQACSQAINARGLETLGIMIPHWYSASPTVQRKLISLFIQSLALKSPITTLSPTSSSPVSAFESEISSTRSPHDVAAVLRWGLRHLQLDNSSFGKDEQWYTQFLQAEKAADYPPKAFTEKLVPLLPPAHLHLLTAALEIFSSLAAHAEANSISGSKLSKMLGLWIISTPRVTQGEDCLTFYAKWDKWGRILEHLFLARIRDEAADHRMPTRLMELVKHYPYTKSPSPGSDAGFLSSPRFSTRRYDALFVRIETEMASTESKNHKNHPLRLIADALKASSRSGSTPNGTSTPSSSSSEFELWESLKNHVSVADADSESYPGLSSLFADETIRFLSLIPTASDTEAKPQAPPPFTLFIPSSKVGRRRSMSLSDRDKAVAAVASAHAKAASPSSSESNGLPNTTSVDPIAIDWGQFSTSGFFSENGGSSGSKLAASLLDNKDVEVTFPRRPSAKRKLPPALIPLPSSRGKSLDLPAPKVEAKEVKQGKSRATKFEIVQLDEAFIDFWSDALLDPISADWPAFVVCKIKSSVPAINAVDSKRVGWLIIEQRFVPPRPPPQAVVATPEKEAVPAARPRPNSPKPSFQSDSTSTKKKRFSFFTSLSSSSVSSSSSTKTDGTKGKRKGGKGHKVGEMGEILKEEEEPSASTSGKTNGTGPAVSSTEVAAVATGAVAVGAAAVVAAGVADEPEVKETPATLVEDAANTQVTAPPPAEDVAEAQVSHPTEAPVARDPTPPPAVTEVEPAPLVEAAVVEEVPAVVAVREATPPPAPVVAEPEPTPPAVIEEPIAEPDFAPVEPEVVAREPTPPPAVAEPEPEPELPVAPAAVEPEVIAREPTPPPVVEEPPVVVAEPEVIAREPTPPPAVVAEPEPAQPITEVDSAALEPEVIAREPTPPPPVAEPVFEEPIAQVEPEPEVIARELTPPPPVVGAEPEVIAREPTPPPAIAEPVPEPEPEPPVEEPVVQAEPEPEVIAREPTPPPAAELEVDELVIPAEPEAEVIPREPTPPPAPEVIIREPTPPPAAEPEVVEPEPSVIPREPTPPPAPEPEVDEPIVLAEPEPEVIAREPTPPPVAEPQVVETEPEAEVFAREPTPPPAVAEPEVEEPFVETQAEPEVIAREPTPPPIAEPVAETEPEPEPAVIAREPTPPPPVAEPEVFAREPIPPPAEPETVVEAPVEEPVVEARYADPASAAVVEEPEAPVVTEPEPAVMIVNNELISLGDPAEELAEPEAEAMPIIEPTSAPRADEGLQFHSAAEVIGSGHIEPLREPEAPNDDALVDLPAVPVVEVLPELPRGETVISHLELTPEDEVPQAQATVEGLLPGGETLGPQAALSIAEEEEPAEEPAATAEEETPMHANGNGNGHEHDDAEKPE